MEDIKSSSTEATTASTSDTNDNILNSTIYLSKKDQQYLILYTIIIVVIIYYTLHYLLPYLQSRYDIEHEKQHVLLKLKETMVAADNILSDEEIKEKLRNYNSSMENSNNKKTTTSKKKLKIPSFQLEPNEKLNDTLTESSSLIGRGIVVFNEQQRTTEGNSTHPIDASNQNIGNNKSNRKTPIIHIKPKVSIVNTTTEGVSNSIVVNNSNKSSNTTNDTMNTNAAHFVAMNITVPLQTTISPLYPQHHSRSASIEDRIHAALRNEVQSIRRPDSHHHTTSLDAVALPTIHNRSNANITERTTASDGNILTDDRNWLRMQQDIEYQKSLQLDYQLVLEKQAKQQHQEKVQQRREYLKSVLKEEPIPTTNNIDHIIDNNNNNNATTAVKEKDIIKLSFHYQQPIPSSSSSTTNDISSKGYKLLKFIRRFDISNTTIEDLLNYVESLEIKPITLPLLDTHHHQEPPYNNDFKLVISYPIPMRIFDRNDLQQINHQTLVNCNITSDTLIRIIYNDDDEDGVNCK